MPTDRILFAGQLKMGKTHALAQWYLKHGPIEMKKNPRTGVYEMVGRK